MKIDFHTHTTASDGIYPVDAVCLLAKQAGLDGLAITDHDTLGALQAGEQAARALSLRLIGSVELSTVFAGREVHLLGYGITEEMTPLVQKLAALRDSRESRGDRMLERLYTLGMPVSREEIVLPKGTAIGRPHIARAMVEKGYVSSVKDAFDRYLGEGCPAYIAREDFCTADAIRLLKGVGALAVVAHPGLIRHPRTEITSAIRSWAADGLDGVEAYHASHSADERAYYAGIARANGLLVTGGSDFHGDPSHGEIGAFLAYWPEYARDTEAFLAKL